MTAMLGLTSYSAHDISLYNVDQMYHLDYMTIARYVEWISVENNLYFKRSQ